MQADTTESFQVRAIIKENSETPIAERVDVFATGNLLEYPVGAWRTGGVWMAEEASWLAPAMGRSKDSPKVMVETLLLGNTPVEMAAKDAFYD